MSPKLTLHAPPVLDRMNLARRNHWLASLISVCLLGSIFSVDLIHAQPSENGQADGQTNGPVRVGLGGNIKLGKWTPIFIDVEPNSTAVRFEAEVLDGDDTPVVYAGELLKDEQLPGQLQALTRIGRTYGSTQLRLFDAGGNQVDSFDLELHGENKLAEIRASTRPMILTLEPEQIFKDAIESVASVASSETMQIVTSAGKGGDLPFHWLGYDGVKSVLLVTSDLDRINQFTDRQLSALQHWVRQGGTLILSVAKNGEQLLAEGGSLASFCPGKYSGLSEFKNSSRLETYCDGGGEQLIPKRGKPLPITKLELSDARVDVDDGASNPLVVRSAMGFGQVVFASFDLDSEAITQWKGFTNLVSQLVASSTGQENDRSVQRTSRGNSVSHFGYEDLIGQLRVPLDRFSKVKFVKFALIAALISLYILCIGPGDYFLLKKVFGRMELTWLTFPLVSLIFCGLAIGISRMTRPNTIQLNQLEIIDVDSIDGRVRGSVWTNLYSPNGKKCSLELDPVHQLGFKIDSDLVSWHGLPGDGLGGMMTSANPGLLKTSYEQAFEFGENGQDLKTRIVGLPLQVSSTKPIFSHWWADNSTPIRSRLKLNPRLKQLEGTVTNPFDFPLKNVRLVFENWAYMLDQPLKANESFDIQTETREKTLRSVLTRKIQQSKSDRSDNSPWDPTDTRVNRIADMMMFYDAAGGSNYTGLTNGYQPNVDMTDHARLRRAILVGEVATPGAILKVNGESTTDQYDQVTTIVRVVFPVEYLEDRNAR